MQSIFNTGASILVLATSFLLCSTARAQQPLQNVVAKLDFAPRTLGDGSEAFDTLIRSQDGLLIYGCMGTA